MKLSVNRETTIGLSVLLVLLVILGVVAVRRFMRPTVPLEARIAREEEKRVEELPDHRSKREADSFSKPALLTPVDTPHRDSLQALDYPGHWNTASKERKRDTPASSTESSLIASDPTATSAPPVSAESGRREHERTRTFAPSATTPTSTDDRYSTAATGPALELQAGATSKSMVVQVSDGEQADGSPRRLDRYAAGDHDQPGPRTTAVDTIPPAPAVGQQFAPLDGPATGMPADREAAHRHAEKSREHEFHSDSPPVNPDAARRTYAAAVPASAPALRYGNDPTSPAPAGYPPPTHSIASADNAASNSPAVPGGYAPENSLRRRDEAPGRMRAEERFRNDGTYEVQPNDSYWTISERVYGSGGYFRALAEQNRGKAARPDRLPPGLVISTPPLAQLEKDYPDLCPRPNRRETVRDRAAGAASMAATAGGGRTYIVQEGDTLSSIARYELGKVSRWAEIYQLNREALGKDYDYLTPGMRLVLPIRDAPSGDRTTRRSDDGAALMR